MAAGAVAAARASVRLIRRSATGFGVSSGATTRRLFSGESCEVVKGSLVVALRGTGHSAQRSLVLLQREEQGGRGKWRGVNADGEKVCISVKDDVELLLDGCYSEGEMAKVRREGQALVAADNVDELVALAWEIVTEQEHDGVGTPGGASGAEKKKSNRNNKKVSLEEAATLIFAEDGPESLYAAHIAMMEEGFHFKLDRRTQSWEPREAAVIEAMRKERYEREIMAREEEAKMTRLNDTITAVLTSGEMAAPSMWQSDPCPHWQETLKQLEGLASRRYTITSESKLARNLLSSLGRRPNEEEAHNLLVSMGLWSPLEPVPFRRAEVNPWAVSDQVQSAVVGLLEEGGGQYLTGAGGEGSSAAKSLERVNLSKLRAYCIDQEDVLEADDAISIEDGGGGRDRLWVHIADPTSCISIDDPIDTHARERGTSLYLPTGNVSMMPNELITKRLSLNSGGTSRPVEAFSVGMLLNDDGSVEEESIIVTQSYVKPTVITYELANALIANKDITSEAVLDMKRLNRAAEKRYAYRTDRDATTLHLPRSKVSVTRVGDDDVNIHLCSEESFQNDIAKAMVSEFMIAANESVAKYCSRNGIAVPFRSQRHSAPIPEDKLIKFPSEMARALGIIRNIARTEVSTREAKPHASIGVDAYTQFTSPIRRYHDLLVHYQMKAHLTGHQPPFTSKSLDGLLANVDDNISKLRQLEKETTSYWIARYFQKQAGIGAGLKHFPAEVIGWKGKYGRGIAMLKDFGMQTNVKVSGVDVGDTILVHVSHVDPVGGTTQFSQSSSPEDSV